MNEQLQLPHLPPPEAPGKPAPLRRWRPDWRKVRRTDLPESLSDIAEIVGMGGVRALVEWRGGTQLVIPRKAGPDHPLARAVGPDVARLLCRYLGGERRSIPSVHSVLAPLRARAIRAEYDAGVRVPDLVWRFGVSERAIRRRLNETDEET